MGNSRMIWVPPVTCLPVSSSDVDGRRVDQTCICYGWEEPGFERQVAAMEALGVDVLATRVSLIDARGKPLPDWPDDAANVSPAQIRRFLQKDNCLAHPSVMGKLRAEVASCCPDRSQLTRTDLRQLTYLQNVLKETLRLYPSVPVNTRTAKKTTVLPTGGGPDRTAPVIVPKGTAVAYSVYSMHRRPDLYGMDAEIFRPERWDESMPMHQNI